MTTEPGRSRRSHRDPADAEEDRARQVEDVSRLRTVERVIHSTGPDLHVVEASAFQFALQGRRRGHHRRCGRVKIPQARVDPVFRDGRARRNIFGKAGVIACREKSASLKAIGARRPADRPLGRDMHVIRAGGLDPLADVPRRGERDANVGIGRQRKGREALGGQKIEFRAPFARGRRHPLERPHDPVHLGPPRVGCQENAHYAASASASSASTELSAETGIAAGACGFGHRRISSRPS